MIRPLIPALIGLLVLAGCESIPAQPPETRAELHTRALAACPTLLRNTSSGGYSQDDCSCLADTIMATTTDPANGRPVDIPYGDAKIIADTMTRSGMSMERVSDEIRNQVSNQTQESMGRCYSKMDDFAEYD